MTYMNKMICSIKVGKRFLKESYDNPEKVPQVFLPFGSEYSIFIKNLNSRKAVVKVSIDGSDVLNGSRLIVEPNSSIDLERFLVDMDKGKRFKFIEKTEKISEHRGDFIDDGYVRIEYQYEKEKPIVTEVITNHIHNHSYGCNCILCRPIKHDYWNNGDTLYRSSVRSFKSPMIGSSIQDCSMVGFASSVNYCAEVNQVNDAGITVGGSESNQSFTYGTVDDLEPNSEVIVIRLKGTDKKNEVVEEPITKKTSKTCPTCGRKNKAFIKFCPECGTNIS